LFGSYPKALKLRRIIGMMQRNWEFKLDNLLDFIICYDCRYGSMLRDFIEWNLLETLFGDIWL
jgi:hypothetical protein